MKTEEDELAPVPLFLSKLKSKLKLLFRSKFKSLFKNEWAWRLFVVLQIEFLNLGKFFTRRTSTLRLIETH
jgi:hypothetical protein